MSTLPHRSLLRGLSLKPGSSHPKSSEVCCPELSRVSILTRGDFGWLPCMWHFGSRCLMLKCVGTDSKLVQSSIASTKCSCVCLDSPETISQNTRQFVRLRWCSPKAFKSLLYVRNACPICCCRMEVSLDSLKMFKDRLKDGRQYFACFVLW